MTGNAPTASVTGIPTGADHVVPPSIARALEPEINARLVADLKALGYRYVCLDLQGYRLGSLNESLPLRPV